VLADREGKNCAGFQGCSGSLIAIHGIDPVPRRDGECEIEWFGSRPILEARIDDLRLLKGRQMLPRKACKVRTHFERDDMASGPSQGQSRFVSATVDLEGVRADGVEPRPENHERRRSPPADHERNEQLS
jgi:hypothetical protein